MGVSILFRLDFCTKHKKPFRAKKRVHDAHPAAKRDTNKNELDPAVDQIIISWVVSRTIHYKYVIRAKKRMPTQTFSEEPPCWLDW